MGQFPTVSLRRHYVRLPSETHRESGSKRDWRYLMGVARLMIGVPGETKHRIPAPSLPVTPGHRRCWRMLVLVVDEANEPVTPDMAAIITRTVAAAAG
jgi:hypothetical protein